MVRGEGGVVGGVGMCGKGVGRCTYLCTPTQHLSAMSPDIPGLSALQWTHRWCHLEGHRGTYTACTGGRSLGGWRWTDRAISWGGSRTVRPVYNGHCKGSHLSYAGQV